MNVTCSAPVCPVILNSSCVFYEGESLIYTGINTNDSLQVALQKIDAALGLTTVVNIYNSDGVLTGNRTVSMNSFSLSFEKDVYVHGVRVGRGGGSIGTNTVVGDSSLVNNTTGTFNTAVGIGALDNNTVGNYNTGIGAYSLTNVSSGEGNTGVGTSAMTFLTTGYSNTAVGYGALYNSTTGFQNIGIGRSSLYNLTSGSENIGIGLSAGSSITTGIRNTIVGHISGQSLSTGSSNTIIGANVSGLAPTTSNNIILSDGDGNIQFKDDGANTILPRLAGVGTRMVVADVSGALSSQAIPTGNITGTGAAGQVTYWTGASAVSGSNNLFWDNAQGRLGIGTNAPTTILDIQPVSGTPTFRIARTGGTEFRIGTSTLAGGVFIGTYTASPISIVANSSTIGTITSGGNYILGVSTDNGQRLQVYGDTLLRGSGASSTTTALTVQNSSSTDLLTVRNDGFLFNRYAAQIGNGTNVANGTNALTVVGYGSYTFNFNNSTGFTFPNVALYSTYLRLSGGGLTFIGNNSFSPGADLFLHAGWYSVTASYGKVSIGTAANSVASRTLAVYDMQSMTIALGHTAASTAIVDIAASTATNSALRIREGVAPTTPNNGDIWSTTTDLLARINGVTYSLINSGLSGGGAAGQVTFWSSATNITGSNNLFWDNTNSRLGIGTNTPAYRLDVNADARINGALVGTVNGTSTRLGASTLGSLTTGLYNTAVGASALSAVTTANENSAFGQSALSSTTGSGNSAFGAFALQVTSTGVNNSAFGLGALIDNTTGSSNTAVGQQALQRNTTGGLNVGIGVWAGRLTVLGTNNTTGSNSIYIGYFTKPADNNQTNQIVIGHNSEGLGSNTTVVGNSSTTYGRWWGNLLLGASSDAGQRLQVYGETLLRGTTTGNMLTVQDSSSGNLLTIRNDALFSLGAGFQIGLTNSLFNNYSRTLAIVGMVPSAGWASSEIAFWFYDRSANNTSGNLVQIKFGGAPSQSFNPTSGNATYTHVQINSTINQVGATGVTRGLYINPTLTAAADWRAIEISAGGAYVNTTAVNASAILQADSTTKGFLPPRMTVAQRTAIVSPAEGLIVFQTDGTIGLYVYANATWRSLTMV